jgi:hypothetical protein
MKGLDVAGDGGDERIGRNGQLDGHDLRQTLDRDEAGTAGRPVVHVDLDEVAVGTFWTVM